MTQESIARERTRSAEGEPLLEVRDLRVYYRTVAGISRAVDGVDLEVRRGEILGIAGESGSGKSTLTTALLRLTKPPGFIAGGSVIFHPREGAPVDLMKLSDSQVREYRWRNLSYLPQGSMNSLNPVMKIEDQFVDVITQHSDIPARKAREMVPSLLEQVGLDPHVARMYPHELSGGMKQRVIIAMSVALNSDLVVADEPTTALDVHIQRVVIQTLASLRDEFGMTVILVTHDMAVHAELADRVAVMYAGKIVEVSDVHQIFKDPKHPYTQGLIASIPKIGGERRRLSGIGGNAPSPLNWPPGCRFHPRCPYVMDVCRQQEPPLLPLVNGRQRPPVVACHLYTQQQVSGGSDDRRS